MRKLPARSKARSVACSFQRDVQRFMVNGDPSFYAGYSRFDDRYPDANKIMEMLLLGFRVEEIPAVMHPRTEGVSMHSGLKPFVYVLRMLFSIVAVWIRIKLFHIDTDAVGEERN